MASLTQWTCVWASSRRWWWTGSPGMLQSMGSLRVRHDWATSLWLFTFMHWRRPKASILWRSAFFMVQLLHPYMTTGKTIALTRWTFVSKLMYLFFNMVSSFVIAFLPRSKHLLISWLQSPAALILDPKKINCHCFHCFPIYLPWNDETGCHDLRFWPFQLLISFWLHFQIISISSDSSVSAHWR